MPVSQIDIQIGALLNVLAVIADRLFPSSNSMSELAPQQP